MNHPGQVSKYGGKKEKKKGREKEEISYQYDARC